MATVAEFDSTQSSENTNQYSKLLGPGSSNYLLVVFVVASGTDDPGEVTSDVGLTFTKVASALFSASAKKIYVFVANALSSEATPTITFDCTGDNATGAILGFAFLTGMTKTGAAAIRQSKILENQNSGETPAITFDAACLTGNVTVAVVGNNSNPAALANPTDWTERYDSGYTIPTTGGEIITRDSGFTGSTITWAGTSATAFGIVAVELDTAAVVQLEATTAAVSAVSTAPLAETREVAGSLAAASGSAAAALTGRTIEATEAAVSASSAETEVVRGLGASLAVLSASSAAASAARSILASLNALSASLSDLLVTGGETEIEGWLDAHSMALGSIQVLVSPPAPIHFRNLPDSIRRMIERAWVLR